MIAARDVAFTRARRHVLTGISLDVRSGEVVAIVGPNGAGKSTLLHLLSGDLRPTSGTVALDGVGLDAWSAMALARRRAVLPQSASLQAPFAVRDVVLLGRTPFRALPNSADHAIADAALDAVALASLAGRRYTELSGGERQRVQLARALAQVWEAHEPGTRLLLLDEPVASLDLAQQQHALEAARAAAARGAAVLVIIHDLNLAAQHTDRIALLCDGQLAECGTPREVLTTPLLRRVFNAAITVVPHPCEDCPLVVTSRTPLGAPRLAAISHP